MDDAISCSTGEEDMNEYDDESCTVISSPLTNSMIYDGHFNFNEDCVPDTFQVASDSDDEKFDDIFNSPIPPVNAFAVKIPCPLCGRKRQRLTCVKCLLNGNFCIQNTLPEGKTIQTKERYHELKFKYLQAQQNRKTLSEKCAGYTARKERIAAIQDEIEKSRNTIAIHKELKMSIQNKIIDANQESDKLRKQTEEKLKIWPTFRRRLDNMKSQYRHNASKLQNFHKDVQTRQDNLKGGTRTRIIQLRREVFPIEEVDLNSRSVKLGRDFNRSIDSWSDEEDETVRSLMAARSNYWSQPDELVSTFGACYNVTGPHGPTLPLSGDYSAYNIWTERNPGGTATSGTAHQNPAHCISAALTYTTQFVNLIAYYIDLRLPHRLSYSEFTNGDLNGGKFNRKVAKLNANVIHLCASQGVHPSFLQPRKTLSNLLLLFDPSHSDLGRRGPFEVASQLAKSMEDSIEKDLVICEESEADTSWNDATFPSDWETINKGAICEEYGLQEMTDQSYLQRSPSTFSPNTFMDSYNVDRSRNTGLLSSVASFFRGWNS